MPEATPPDPDPASLQTRVDALTDRLAKVEAQPNPKRVRNMADEHDKSTELRILESRIKQLEKEGTKYRDMYKRTRDERDTFKTKLDTIESEYKTQVNDWKAQYEAKEQELAELAQEAVNTLDEIESQRDEYKTIAEAPPDERITQLEQQIKLGKIREKFRGIESDLAEGFDLDRAWKATDFDPAKVEDVDKFNAEELAAEWRKTVGGMFKPMVEGQTPAQGPTRKPPLTVAAEVPSRGARDSTGSRITYKREEISPPGWAAKNPTLYEAIQNGNAVEVE
jgi:hypothetical protein